MSASAAAAVSAAAAASSAASAVAARREACKVEIANFDSKSASIQQAQSYADCVRSVYPTAMDPGTIIVLKAVFVIALLCGIAGAWVEAQKSWSDVVDIAMWGLLCFLGGPLLLGALGGIAYGVYWVIT